MHEWSLAYAVVNSAVESCLKQGVEKARFRVLLGELQQIDEEIFKLAVNELNSQQEKCSISFELCIEKASFKCRKCGYSWSFSSEEEKLNEENREFVHFVPEAIHSFTRCAKCGSPDFGVEKGRGVSLEWIE